MTDNAASREARAREVNRIAELLIATWNRVDPKSGVALYPASYIATFADLARAVVDDRGRGISEGAARQSREGVERIIAALQNEQDRLDGEDYIMDTRDCINVIREMPVALADEAASQPREGCACEMMARDHARMRKAGTALAETALYAVREYDGLHRLSLAVAGWATAVANEGDRAALHDTAPTDQAQRGEVERQALRNIAEGNLGDAPWQANYDRIREAARAALAQSGDPS